MSVKDLARGIVWASSLNTVQEDVTVLLSVLNASGKDVFVDKEAVIGYIEMDVRKIKIGESPETSESNQLFQLLEKYKHVFQWSEFSTDRTNLTEHRINTENALPIKQRSHRLLQAAQDEVERQVDEMMRNKVIEESQSPWANPIVLFKKKKQKGKEQEYRFCIDFRKLNEATIKVSYPLPRIDDTVDALGGSYVFSTVDCAGGFFQVPLEKGDREKTAFIANHKLYQFIVMPFAGYKLKPSKCCFGMSQVSFLGYVISGDGLKPDAAKTKVIANMGVSKSREEVKRFLGMLSYYRRFIPNFSMTAACLFELTKDTVVYTWSKEADEAFKLLKEQLVKAPILIYPNFKNGFSIYTDASGLGIGAVLTQVVDRKIHPVAYASRQLNASE
ncbi:unnamed protein product [Brachionus calyciflorus]|uniref:Reverse transcriptase/retrotransposon-derived protein RNase H-like domain-containing protein n=1 Tax=Brachionus calyciflorus TaxID=104777 RepID=A0A814DT16_9BILA|nr:unnamed protein product [Brachionus calyciflorus]